MGVPVAVTVKEPGVPIVRVVVDVLVIFGGVWAEIAEL